MYYRLGDELSHGADDVVLRYEFSLEQIFIAHFHRRLAVYLSPSQVARIRNLLRLGATAERGLSAVQRRSNDILAGMAAAKRRFVLEPDENLAEHFEIKGTGDVHVRVSGMFNDHYSHRPNLLVEHIENDRRAVEFLFRMVCRLKGLPTDLIQTGCLHGGGSSLATVIRNQPDNACFGLCVADRDTSPFDHQVPMKPGGTAALAYSASVDHNLIRAGEYGHSSSMPYYGFSLTGARTMEGCISPRVLQVYFDRHPTSRQSARPFLQAFPNFPILDANEWKLWFSLDLKRGGLGLEYLSAALEKAVVPDQMIHADRILAADAAIMPGDASNWLWSESLGKRSVKDIETAFKKDCEEPMYAEITESLWQLVWDFLAADQRANLT